MTIIVVWVIVRVLHFTNFLTVHQKNLDQIYSRQQNRSDVWRSEERR